MGPSSSISSSSAILNDDDDAILVVVGLVAALKFENDHTPVALRVATTAATAKIKDDSDIFIMMRHNSYYFLLYFLPLR